MIAIVPVRATRARFAGARRWFVAACLCGCAVGLAVGITVAADVRTGPSEATSRAEVEAFRSALDPVIAGGAQVVALGLQPGLTDVRDGRYPPEVLITMCDGWVAELASLRAELGGVAAAGRLTAVRDLYLLAFDGYIEVAKSLRTAVTTTDPVDRVGLIEQAASAGRAADGAFDRAAEALEALMVGSGLPEEE